MLNMDNLGQTAGIGGGSQSGSDFEFSDPQTVSIDTMMQSGEMDNLLNYQSALGGIPHGYGNAFDPNMLGHTALASSQLQHRGSMGGMAEGQAPIDHRHRLSISSTGAYSGNERHPSIAGSETTSPDGLLASGITGDNPFANNSNDSISSQQHNEDADNKRADEDSNSAPAWSELKTKAGKERKRLPLACIACRRKKIRCSGEKPACKHCLRSRIPCVYKVTTRKATPRTDYMAMLDKRLKRMEERVIKVIPKEEQGIVASTGRAVLKPPLPPPPPRSAGSAKKRVADTAFDEELDEWAGIAASSDESKEDLSEEIKKEPLTAQNADDEHNLLQEGADKLPSKELQEHLSEVFFDFVYCQSYPLLHKPSFMRRLAQNQVPPVLMLAVCAISARFSHHPEVRTEPAFLRGEIWAAPAREIALRRYDTPNITILIVYLILGLHEFGTCQGGRSWMLGGMAQRMAYALQLHKDLDHYPSSRQRAEQSELTFTDREIRRRTMWSCFLMDRFNSSGTERPIFISEQYIRAQLPIKESYFQMEINGPTENLEGDVPNPADPDTGQTADATQNMGVTAYLIRLVAIWGRLIHYMNLGGKDQDQHPMWDEQSTFHAIRQDTQAWLDSLPESLLYSPENVENHASEKIANQFLFLHITYNQIVLFMNRFAIPNPGSRSKIPKTTPPAFVAEAYKAALEAANQISALVNEAMDYHVVAPFAGYSAFYSSTVHIYGAFSNNSTLEASSKQNLAFNVKYLTKLKKYWGMFHFVTENLRDLYRRHADAARSGHKPGNRDSGEQSIFQYGDWFDRYPHGVSGTDFEEPSVETKKEPGADAVLGQKSDLQSVEEFFSKLAPPSRAVQKEPQQSSTRKMAKTRRNTKSESKAANSQPDQDTKPVPQQQLVSDDMLNTQGLGINTPGFPPGGLAQPQNPMMIPQSQQLMSQLDRQMVLDSYAGVNTVRQNAPMQPTSNPMLDPTNQLNLDSFDFTALAPTNSNTSPGGMFGDGSAAWFMPFNMEPPAGGEDSNMFNAFDWANMANFGDMPPGLQGTGLTPGREIDVETGPDGLARVQSGGGLNGLDGP